jgi:hypothetical protein
MDGNFKEKQSKINNVILMTSILAILLSFLAVCIAIVRNEPFNLDWVGIVIAVLSILVMVLVTWQIFALIDIKKVKEDVENNIVQKTEKLRGEILKMIIDEECKLSSFVHYQRAIGLKNNIEFDGYMYAIASWNDASHIDEEGMKIIDKSLDGIKIIKDKDKSIELIAKEYIEIERKIIDYCIKILSDLQTENENKDDVLKFFVDLKEYAKINGKLI